MDRKLFLKTSALAALGLGAAVRATASSSAQRAVGQVGFNHLPNIEDKTMNTVLHKANTRGHANHGWFNARHSFSFANYYNPERMHFGVLRVLNDDTIAPGKGFGMHPHDNMEIITIPLSGDLEHKDNMGNSAVIRQGDVQVMSAGTGIYHSEFNANADREIKLLQIWVFPNKQAVEPRYDQITLKNKDLRNQLYQILSPNATDDGVWIHQDAWFHLGDFEAGEQLGYQIKRKGNGVYAFLISGKLKLNGHDLEQRDALGVWDTDKLTLEFEQDSKVLLMDVPMAI